MVHFGTPRVGPNYTPNIGPIDEGLISISTMESHHRFQLRERGHMTYHTTALLPNSCGPMADGPFRDPNGRSYPHPKYWTHRWRIDINIDHGISPIKAQLSESGHMTYHTTALLPNSCGPMADGPFRDPKGRSYPHPKYWTHRWRIDINIDHGISPIEPS